MGQRRPVLTWRLSNPIVVDVETDNEPFDLGAKSDALSLTRLMKRAAPSSSRFNIIVAGRSDRGVAFR
jgi:hypothetical protein